MITQDINDPPPLNAKITRIIGNKAIYFCDGDQEVMQDILDMQRHQLLLNRNAKKQERMQAVNRITVVTQSGNPFDGDEASQQRMHRAIDIMEENETIEWVLADNTKACITSAELREAMRLAFLKQSSQWIAMDDK